MDKNITLGARLEVPVANLTTDYKKLLAMLTVDNPEYKNAQFFGMGKVKASIPKKIFMFDIDRDTKTIFLPRNIDSSFYVCASVPTNRLSTGSKIPKGVSGKFKLREGQREFMDDTVLPYVRTNPKDGALDMLLIAHCGSGKTIMGLYLASIYQRKTVVCATTKKIGNQFKDAVKELFPNWTCGWEDGKKEYDITLGTYALLSKEKYDSRYFDKFGHIILDEFHRCGAETYSRILNKATCKHRTSLTATFRRKDGLHHILAYHAGEHLEMIDDTASATVYPITTGIEINEDLFRGTRRFPTILKSLAEYQEVAVRTKKLTKNAKTVEIDRGMITLIRGNMVTLTSSLIKKEACYDAGQCNFFKLTTISAPQMDTEISEYDTRNDLVLSLAKAFYAMGRKTIILSKRKDQLLRLEATFRRYGIPTGLFISEKSAEYKDYCKMRGRTVEENAEFTFNEARVILGIDKLAEEGMDAPTFDTLIYLHGIKDIQQSIGRILRIDDDKQNPIVCYLIDNTNSSNKAFYGKKTGARQMFIDLEHRVMDECTVREAIEQIKIEEQDGKQ